MCALYRVANIPLWMGGGGVYARRGGEVRKTEKREGRFEISKAGGGGGGMERSCGRAGREEYGHVRREE